MDFISLTAGNFVLRHMIIPQQQDTNRETIGLSIIIFWKGKFGDVFWGIVKRSSGFGDNNNQRFVIGENVFHVFLKGGATHSPSIQGHNWDSGLSAMSKDEEEISSLCVYNIGSPTRFGVWRVLISIFLEAHFSCLASIELLRYALLGLLEVSPWRLECLSSPISSRLQGGVQQIYRFQLI